MRLGHCLNLLGFAHHCFSFIQFRYDSSIEYSQTKVNRFSPLRIDCYMCSESNKSAIMTERKTNMRIKHIDAPEIIMLFLSCLFYHLALIYTRTQSIESLLRDREI